jgi:hypothetical protein
MLRCPNIQVYKSVKKNNSQLSNAIKTRDLVTLCCNVKTYNVIALTLRITLFCTLFGHFSVTVRYKLYKDVPLIQLGQWVLNFHMHLFTFNHTLTFREQFSDPFCIIITYHFTMNNMECMKNIQDSKINKRLFLNRPSSKPTMYNCRTI